MDLFEKVKDFKVLEQEVKELDAKIRDTILAKLVNLRYKMYEIEVGYPRYKTEQSEKIKVYYPILDLPEGFSKSDEKFFRQYANQVAHTYSLTNNEGNEIQIEETATFERFVYESDEVAIRVNPYMVLREIQYKINISELSYKFYREFTYQEMMEQVVESKDMILTCEKVISTDQESYENYIKALGKKEGIISLKDLVESQQNEIQITPTLNAEVRINQRVKNETVWYESEKIWVRLKVPYTLSTITIHTKTIDDVSIGVKEFEYLQSNKEFKNEMTLNEVFQLIKE